MSPTTEEVEVKGLMERWTLGTYVFALCVVALLVGTAIEIGGATIGEIRHPEKYNYETADMPARDGCGCDDNPGLGEPNWLLEGM